MLTKMDEEVQKELKIFDEVLIYGETTAIDLEILNKKIFETKNKEIANLYLSEEEKKIFYSFRNEKRITEWLGGRIAAKKAVLKILEKNSRQIDNSLQLEKITIHTSKIGKPYLNESTTEKKPLKISISHSEKWAVAFASYTDCGIDIQKINNKIERLQNKFIKKNEVEILSKELQKYTWIELLTLLWSAKEAEKKKHNEMQQPGFLEMELTRIEKQNNLYILTLSTKKYSSHSKIRAAIYENYACAITWTDSLK